MRRVTHTLLSPRAPGESRPVRAGEGEPRNLHSSPSGRCASDLPDGPDGEVKLWRQLDAYLSTVYFSSTSISFVDLTSIHFDGLGNFEL